MRNSRSKPTPPSTASTVETTYGRVTVFSNQIPSEPRLTGRSLAGPENDNQIQMNNFHKSDKDKKLDDVDEDFFGFENEADKANQTNKEDANFIDEQFFGEYLHFDSTNVNSSSKPIQASKIEDSNDLKSTEDFDYIDSQFFSSNSSKSTKEESIDSNAKNITVDDIKAVPDLNYIGRTLNKLIFSMKLKIP